MPFRKTLVRPAARLRRAGYGEASPSSGQNRNETRLGVPPALFAGPARHVDAGRQIFEPGQAADELFLIRSGLVKLTAVSPDGDELTLEVFGPGEVFGELCLRNHVHGHWATALEPSEIASLHRDEFLRRLAQRPDLLQQFLDLLVGRLLGAYTEIEARAFEPAVQRLGRRLLQIAAFSTGRAGRRLPQSFGHVELARLLGVERETVTRAMRQLRRIRVIDVPTRGPVRVHEQRLMKWLTRAR